jgi:hypothetical protein
LFSRFPRSGYVQLDKNEIKFIDRKSWQPYLFDATPVLIPDYVFKNISRKNLIKFINTYRCMTPENDNEEFWKIINYIDIGYRLNNYEYFSSDIEKIDKNILIILIRNFAVNDPNAFFDLLPTIKKIIFGEDYFNSVRLAITNFKTQPDNIIRYSEEIKNIFSMFEYSNLILISSKNLAKTDPKSFFKYHKKIKEIKEIISKESYKKYLEIVVKELINKDFGYFLNNLEEIKEIIWLVELKKILLANNKNLLIASENFAKTYPQSFFKYHKKIKGIILNENYKKHLEIAVKQIANENFSYLLDNLEEIKEITWLVEFKNILIASENFAKTNPQTFLKYHKKIKGIISNENYKKYLQIAVKEVINNSFGYFINNLEEIKNIIWLVEFEW